VRVCAGRSALNERSTSRWRKVGEVSAEVRCERRVDSGGESGFGTVRARAMLQALAPRSRTEGKWRFISL
jgi:hypothetical protein